jgi:hypothetical protein
MREKYGYPEFTDDAKRRILGLNSAKLYGINMDQHFNPVPRDYERRMPIELKRIMEVPDYAADNISKVRERYTALGSEPSNLRYGWVRTRS